jgi:hypothetical protein
VPKDENHHLHDACDLHKNDKNGNNMLKIMFRTVITVN